PTPRSPSTSFPTRRSSDLEIEDGRRLRPVGSADVEGAQHFVPPKIGNAVITVLIVEVVCHVELLGLANPFRLRQISQMLHAVDGDRERTRLNASHVKIS